MKREDIHTITTSEEALQSSSEGDLRQVVAKHSYFQTARILLLKKLKLEGNYSFDKELKKSAVYVGDRAKLYTYLNPLKTYKQGESADFISKKPQGAFVPATDFSMESEQPVDDLFLPNQEAPSPARRTADPLADLESQAPIESPQSNEGWDLIDQFVQSDTKKIKVTDTSGTPIVNLAENSVKANNTILTETLASIYIKQKKYDKAIGIFESLSLKFPEKSAFFAARIGELKQVQANS